MKILVTGATGGLGRNLVERLLKDDCQVTATGRDHNIGKLLAQQGAIFKPANLENHEEIHSLFIGQDIVYHCAALSAVWGKYQDFYAANMIATKNITAECMRHNIKRLIYVSTPSLYFNFTDRFNIKETDPLAYKPANFYVKTKMLAEQVIDAAAAAGLAVITIRPRGIFGPYDTALLPKVINLNQQGKLPLINGGKSIIDLTYVENVVEALLLCSKAPLTSLGKKYNITNGEPIAMISFLEKLLRALEVPMRTRKVSYKAAYAVASILESWGKLLNYSHEPIVTRYSVGVLAKSQTLNIDAARLELSFVPKYSLDEGISRFVKWWRAQYATS